MLIPLSILTLLVGEEDDSEAKKDHSGPDPRGAFLSSSLKVDLMEEHDDGSATYTITSSDGTLHRVFEAFPVTIKKVLSLLKWRTGSLRLSRKQRLILSGCFMRTMCVS